MNHNGLPIVMKNNIQEETKKDVIPESKIMSSLDEIEKNEEKLDSFLEFSIGELIIDEI